MLYLPLRNYQHKHCMLYYQMVLCTRYKNCRSSSIDQDQQNKQSFIYIVLCI